MENNQFDEIEWHDTAIESMEIDRRDPGNRDEVILVISQPGGERTKAVFRDCYALEAQLNFGIVAAESILSARQIFQSSRLDEIRRSW